MASKKEARLNSTGNQNTNQSKDNQIIDYSKCNSQLETIRKFFEISPASRFMCAVTTGIPIQNVCRLAGMLFEAGDIAVIKYDRCAITGQTVQFLSCDRSLFPKIPVQLDLFSAFKERETSSLVDYELSLRIVDLNADSYIVQENQTFSGALRILPVDHKKVSETGWMGLSQGSLAECDDFVSNLVKLRK